MRHEAKPVADPARLDIRLSGYSLVIPFTPRQAKLYFGTSFFICIWELSHVAGANDIHGVYNNQSFIVWSTRLTNNSPCGLFPCDLVLMCPTCVVVWCFV